MFRKPDPVDAILFRMEQQGRAKRTLPLYSWQEPGFRGAVAQACAHVADDSGHFMKSSTFPSASDTRTAGEYREEAS